MSELRTERPTSEAPPGNRRPCRPPPAGGSSRTVGDALDALAAALAASRVADARRTACDVLAALFEVPRFWPHVNRNAVCDAPTWLAAERAAAKLVSGAPFAYAVGRAEFRYLTLEVDERVLIPRPETELLVEHALAATVGRGGVAIDVGTGSGAVALSLAAEGRFDRVVATDVSLDALAVARSNAVRSAAALRTPVEFRHGSLLAPLGSTRARVIVSNPPYVAHHEAGELPASVRDWEPAIALFSGGDGLAATRSLIAESGAALVGGGFLALEVDSRRAKRVARLVSDDSRFTDVAVRADLAGRERFVTARKS